MDYQDLKNAVAMWRRIALTSGEEYLVNYLEANLDDIWDSYAQSLEDRWIDRHSVNCYYCGRLFDERESVGHGPDGGGEVCVDCQNRMGI